MGILNLMLLSSNHDTLVNLPQWFAMLGCVLAASYIAGKLGGNRRSQIMAALIVITTPMVVLQSTTTQNDLLVTLWTMIFLVFAIQDLAKPSISTAILAGCSLGLAMLTKPTAYLLIFVWLLTWVGLRLWKLRLRGLPALATAALCAILICAPYWWRNYQVFQHPLGPQSESREFYNQPISLKGATLNLIRNTGIHIILPSAMADSATNWLADGLKARGWDLNDPVFTYNDHLFRFPTFSVSEDRSGNFLLLLLISCLPIYLFVNRKKSATNFQFAYAILLTLTALLFALLLTWQAYQSRLMVGWFVMAAPLVGIMLGSGRRWLHWVSCAFLLAGILPYIWLNPTKQLWTDWNIFNLPRREVMMRREEMLVDYVQAQELLSRDRACHTVGLISEGYDWEYPLSALLRDSQWRLQTQSYEIRHILVQNVTASLEDPAFTPCAVLVTASNRPESIKYRGRPFTPALQTANIWVYLPDKR
jgi:4-amino-4-deoxy-L-arabinose transferase-like glycosyltransferase